MILGEHSSAWELTDNDEDSDDDDNDYKKVMTEMNDFD